MKSRILVVAMLLATSSTALFAATKNSASLTISEAVSVQGVHLAPGNYKVRWDGPAPAVQVSFLQGKKVFATVPATLVEHSTPYDGAIETDGQNVVHAIDFSRESLVFISDPSANTAIEGSTQSSSAY